MVHFPYELSGPPHAFCPIALLKSPNSQKPTRYAWEHPIWSSFFFFGSFKRLERIPNYRTNMMVQRRMMISDFVTSCMTLKLAMDTSFVKRHFTFPFTRKKKEYIEFLMQQWSTIINTLRGCTIASQQQYEGRYCFEIKCWHMCHMHEIKSVTQSRPVAHFIQFIYIYRGRE